MNYGRQFIIPTKITSISTNYFEHHSKFFPILQIASPQHNVKIDIIQVASQINMDLDIATFNGNVVTLAAFNGQIF
jgi:hypothetical protein